MKKNTWVFVLVLSLITILFPVSHAMMVADPSELVIKEFNGNLYQMKRNDWHEVNSYSDLEGHQVKTKDWYKIIKSDPANEANALLHALSQFLDKDELWPYVEAGLLRKNNPSIPVYDQVANNAYQAWPRQSKLHSLEYIRTNPIYAKNLTKQVNWDNLFKYPSKEQLSLDDAIDKLKTTSLLNQDDYQGKRLRYQAINRIAMHTNADDLLPLIKDESFEVALGSWVALSRLAPKQVAKTVVDHSLWLQDEIQYTYGSGCIRHTGQLVPVVAALDLFVDYLSAEQIKQVLTEVPDMWAQKKFDQLNVSHPKIKPLVLSMKAETHVFKQLKYVFNSWKHNEKYQQMAELEAPFTDMKQASRYVSAVGFDKKIADFLLESLASDPSDKELNRFMHYAFNKESEHSYRYLKALIASPYFEQNHAEIIEYLIGYKNVWPKKWLPLKQQIVNQINPLRFEDKYLPVNIKLALN
ncbi:hypothetical protein [Marinicella rhabdoformis]|uniref:hypothetical protein n=1 Tax=Marinicella rhabdoformis TaxID=2580566 RepID=UPI0012AED8DB|nr:hypothetical protein [Marinicella rhabdoformis]